MRRLRYYLLVFWACSPILILAQAQQRVDKVIDMGIYKSYYCYGIKNPLYVTYKLFKGGGPCDRKEARLDFTQCGERTASDADYTNSGYERGHLVNAEDFAITCLIEKKTFCFFNCVPQTKALNHGNWLAWEAKIRKLSQTKHLFVVVGSVFGNRRIKPGNAVLVPDGCYKIVYDGSTGTMLYSLYFPNDTSGGGGPKDLSEIKAMLVYPLVPQQNLYLYQ